MRQGILCTALAFAVCLSTYSVQAQTTPDAIQESRISPGEPKVSVSTIDRPTYSELQINDLFNKIRIGLTCTDEANSIRNYFFSEADVENYLNQFESIATREPQLSRTAAQDKMDILLDQVNKTIDEVGVAEDVILHDYELLYSDDLKVFKVIRMEMDALIKGTDKHLEMLIVDLDGDFRILSAGKD